jgi:HEAT repeat protein
VRVAVARGLGTIGDPAATPTLARLAADIDPLVRAAALEAAAGLGCPSLLGDLAVSALANPVWEVRKGAAVALGAAAPDVAIRPLLAAIADPHIDVRKAAVRSLARWAALPSVSEALTLALEDTDADVRGYARRALVSAS